jgi:hypothetical protein
MARTARASSRPAHVSGLLVLLLAAVLLTLRLPSLAQPMGADQSLYAYVGDRILDGGLPYRDAWDQKPPAIHFLYAALRAVWPADGVVAAADLAAAGVAAWLLHRAGLAVGSPAGGAAASLLFLLLSNPALTRLGGIRLRSQCETFIAVAVAGALVLIVRDRKPPAGWPVLAAGGLCGIAFTLKYNTAVFLAAGVVTLWLSRRLTPSALLRLGAGFALPVLVMLALFALRGTLRPLLDATIQYNLQYSAETYGGGGDVARYLLTFPIDRARADALWLLGGAGSLLLLAGSLRDRMRLVPVVWVAAACLSIAINGSRSLPQYFVQAGPLLALAAGWGGAVAWEWLRGALGPGARYLAAAALLVTAVAVWRVGDDPFPKLVEQTGFDARYALGRMTRDQYLARYDDDRKYSALAAARLGEFLRARTTATDRVYVFGFASAAYVAADRVSASRFFWSRPVIVDFNAGRPGYGVDGLLSDLAINRPAVIALQQRDWAPDVADSAAFFMATPRLAGWLRAHYVEAPDVDGFDVWLRRSRVP